MSHTPDPITPKPKCRVIALTGSIGSGKSTVADLMAGHGATIIDADLLAREVVAPGTPALDEISRTFGAKYILPNGELDRKALGTLVFSDPAKRSQLEKITHPRIRSLFLERLAKARLNSGLIVYVVPLFFESGLQYSEIDAVVVVTAPKNTCLERVVNRDGSTRELAEKKFNSQVDPAIKEAKADYVVVNDGSQQDLATKVSSLYDSLIK